MVLTSVLYGLAFAMGIGVADVISAGLTRSLGVLRTVFLLQLIGMVAMTALGLSSGQLGGLEPRYWLIMAGLTLLVAGFYLGFFKALQLGPIALVGPIVAAHSVVVALLAVVFLGESVSRWQVGAMALTVIGVAIASVDFRALRQGKTIIGLGVMLAIVVCVAAGFWQFALAALSKQIGWFAPVYLTRLMMVAILLPVLMVRRELPWRGLDRRLALAVVFVGVVESAALLAFTRGSQIGIVAIVAAASTAYPIVPIIGGIVWYGERLSAIQFGGLALVTLGLFGLTLLP